MSRSILAKTSELKDVRPVAGSPVGADGSLAALSLQVGGAGAQTQTLTYASMADGDVVTVTIGPDAGDTTTITITLDATTGASDTAAAAAIADEINATAKISNLVSSQSVVGIVGLVGRQKGTDATFYATSTVTGSGGVTVGAATSPTDATSIRPGVMCELSTATKVQGTASIGAAVGTAGYKNKVMTVVANGGDITLASGDRISFTVKIDVDGRGAQDFNAETTWDTNLATTLGAIVATLNTKLGSKVTVAIASTNNLTFTGATAGYDFDVIGSYYDSNNTLYAPYTVKETTATDCSGAGVAMFSHTVEQDANGDLVFGTGAELSAMQVGQIHALLDSGITVAAGDPVFVRVTTSGSEIAGAFRNAADLTDCLPLTSYGFVGKFAGANFTDMDGNNVAPLVIERV
jgi:hypothetical protein